MKNTLHSFQMINDDSVIFIPTKRELSSILGVTETTVTNNIEYAKYRNIDIVVSGIGKTNTAVNVAKYFSANTKNNALMIGICGAYHGMAELGEVYSIQYDYFVDEASLDNLSTLTTLSERGFDVANCNRAEFHTIDGYTVKNSNTVSLIPCVDEISQLYQSKTDASLENMEGASFGHALSFFGVKGYQLRSVSNFCGDKSRQAWDIKKACQSLRKAVDNIIDNKLLHQ